MAAFDLSKGGGSGFWKLLYQRANKLTRRGLAIGELKFRKKF